MCFVTEFYDRTIVSLKKMKKYINIDEQYITCSGNISCTKLSRHLHDNKLPGYEFLYGIPGTIAGAVTRMQELLKEIMPNVYSIDLLDEKGNAYTLTQDNLSYSYRTSNINTRSIMFQLNF